MNKYDQVKVLGQGGFGKALLVKRKTDNQQFVIKEVRLTSLGPKDREEAMKEVKVLASLKHPYIVDYVESFQERGCLFIVMGYADGGDLAQKIEKAGRKLFSEDEILHDFIEIALGIKYIHDRKILHRDLKGQNVFLMKDGTVKLGDFGIARVLEHTFQVCKTQIGTPYYLSPEICQGKNYNMKTDIWSLGCILYELCTLKHAFEAGNMNQLLMNIVRGRYTPIPAQYSEDLKNLVNRMLTKEPEKRPNINQILATPFIKEKLSKFLDKTMLDYEMQHTILHGRKPFQAPTIIPKKAPVPTVAAGGNFAVVAGDDHSGFTKRRDEQNKKMQELEKRQKELDEKVKQREAELKKKEEELRKRQEQQRKENEKRDAEIKKMEEDLAKREKEEKARIAAKELEIKKQQQRIAQIEVEKRDAELKHQESLIMRREREEQARLEAREKQLQQQARANNGQDEFDRRAAEIKRRQEELERRGREERARLDAQEKQLQQMKADQERRYQQMQQDIQQQKLEYQNQQQKYQQQPKPSQQPQKHAQQPQQPQKHQQPPPQQPQKYPQQNQNQQQLQRQKEANERAAYEKRQREYEEKKQRLEQERLEAEKKARQNEWEENHRIANQNRNRDRGGPFAYDNPQGARPQPRQQPQQRDQYNRNDGGMTDDERRRIFFEQQQAAQANRARVRNDGAGIMDCFNYNEPEPQNNRNRNNNRRGGNANQGDEDAERMRIYMEQRREAMANKERQRNMEMRGNAVMDAICDPHADEDERRERNRRNMEKQRQQESEEEERRRIFMEQRRAALANRDRMRQMEMDGGEARNAIMRNDPDDDDDEYERKRRNQKKRQNDLDEEERRRIFMEQKRAAQANRDRMRQMEMGGGEARDAIMRNDPDDDEDEKRRRNDKKKEYDEDAMKEFYRQQRHEARANREKLRQAEFGTPDYAKEDEASDSSSSSHHHHRHRHHHHRDGSSRGAESESSDNGDGYERNGKKKQMSIEEINAYMREQRHIAAANKARAQAAEAESQFEKDLKENAKDDEPLPQKKKQMDMDEINAYMREQRHIARANKARAQAAEAESQFERDLKENAKDDEPLPQKKKQMDMDEINAYMREQRHIARANKARAQAAEAESQFERDLKENAKDDEPLPQKKKDMSLEEINAYMREQRHIARANKAKAQAAEAESQFEKDLKENSKDDEPLPQKKKDMSLEEINAYMREQRHIARANKAKAQAAEAESQLEKELKENAKDDEPLPQKKKDMSLEEINAYMREQRHIARANKAKAQAAEAESQLEKELKENAKDDEPLPQKKKDMSLEEINAYMREQRHIARANKAKAQAAEAESQLEKELKENAKDDEPLPQKKKDMSLEEINAYMREQRHIARANREKAERAELGGPEKGAANPDDDDEPPPQKEKKPEMSLAEINAFMREQRHARRANRARAEAEAAGTNMDKLIAQAEAEQRANPRLDQDDQPGPPQPPEEDDEPPPQKEKKPEMSLAEINAFMREQRHARRANRARAEAELQGVNMDQLIAEAEAEQRANPKVDAGDSSAADKRAQPPPEEDDEPPPQKEKKPEMSLAEINAFMREQRHARRANRARAEAELQGVNMDQLIAQAEAEQRANPKVDAAGNDNGGSSAQPEQPPEEDNEPPPQKEKKPEMSLQEINAFMREQRHARRANKARAEAELQGINMDDLIAQAESEQRANPKIESEQPAQKPASPPQQQPQPQKRPPSASSSSAPKPASDSSAPDSAAPSQPQRMTVAEARRQAMAKKAQQKQQQKPQQAQQPAAQPQPEPAQPSEQPQQSQPQQLLDKAAMRELFAQQRNEMRLNRERIKAAQDGSRDPNLPSSVQSQNSNKRPTPKQQPQQLPKVPISSSSRLSSGSDKGSNPLKNSARRIIQSTDSPRPSSSGTGSLQKQLQSKNSKLIQPTIPVDYDENSDDDDSSPAGPMSGRLDMSQALNSKSASNFLKSRSIVLKTLGENDLNEDLQDQIAADEDLQQEEVHLEEEEEVEDEEKAATKQLSAILDKAKFLNDALNLDENNLEDDENDSGGTSSVSKSGEEGTTKKLPDINNAPQFFLQNKVLNLPVVHDDDSLSYRAEAIRAFLEKEIGLDKLIELKQAVAESDSTSVDVNMILKDVEPGVIVLAQQLLILDEACEQAQR